MDPQPFRRSAFRGGGRARGGTAPDRGNIAPISAKVSAPARESRPRRSHTPTRGQGERTCRTLELGRRKTPPPRLLPTMGRDALQRPRVERGGVPAAGPSSKRALEPTPPRQFLSPRSGYTQYAAQLAPASPLIALLKYCPDASQPQMCE